MAKKNKKKTKKKQRGYDSKLNRQKNVEQRLEHVKQIKPFGPEPEGNKEKIGAFYRTKAKDKQWEEVRK